MTQPTINPLIQARNLIQAGRVDDARALLVNLVRQNPKAEQGWLLLSDTLSDPKQKIDCLQRVLKLNPNNQEAQTQLDNLTEPRPAFAATPPPPKVSPFTTGALRELNSLEQSVPEPVPPSPTAAPPTPRSQLAPRTAWFEAPVEPERAEPESAIQPTVAQEWKPDNVSADTPESSLRSTPPTATATHNATRAAKVRAARAKPAPPPPNNAELSRQILMIGGAAIAGLLALFILVGGYVYVSNNNQKQQATQVAITRQAAISYASAVYPTLPPTFTITPTSTITATPTQTATPTRTPVPTPKLPPPTIAAQMDTIQQQVADLRGLSVTTDLQRYVIEKNKVDATLSEMYLDNGGSRDSIDDDARVLTALRLINPTFDLFKYTLSGISDGLGGFYTPWSKRLYVIGTKFGGVERFVYSHEYDHALTDAHFNIAGMGVYPSCTRTEQQCEAIRGLVEGDATLLMNQWLDQYASPQDINDVFNQNYQPSNRTLPDQFPPPYASREAAFPYVEGLDFVQSLYQEGNWGAVNQAYQTLPTTTEQILHPRKFLDGEQAKAVDPIGMDGVLNADWRLLKSDSLGEWMTYLILSYSADMSAQVDLGTGAEAAAGWGGDNYQVYYNDITQKSVLIVHWVWDTQNDADEFKQAMLFYQDKRFRGSKVDLAQGDCWEANGETSCLYWRGAESFWIIAPNHDLLNGILARYSNFK